MEPRVRLRDPGLWCQTPSGVKTGSLVCTPKGLYPTAQGRERSERTLGTEQVQSDGAWAVSHVHCYNLLQSRPDFPPGTLPMYRLFAALPLALLAVAVPAAAQKPPTVPDTVIFEAGIEYTNPDNQHLQLDMAKPKTGDGPFPAILCVHGGGFRAGNRNGYDGQIIRLAEKGYVAVTVSYRLAPKYPFPAAVHDTKAAVRWLRANAKKYHIDPERIGVTGGSAGGTLAQMLGVTDGVKEFEGTGGNEKESSKVACVVNYYGANDFTKSYGKSVDAAEVLPLYLGGNLEKARGLHIKASPLYWVTPNAVPTLCIHGTDDKYVAHEQSEWLVEKLKAAGVEAELLTLDKAGHGFQGKDAETAEKAMIAFFDKHLKKK